MKLFLVRICVWLHGVALVCALTAANLGDPGTPPASRTLGTMFNTKHRSSPYQLTRSINGHGSTLTRSDREEALAVMDEDGGVSTLVGAHNVSHDARKGNCRSKLVQYAPVHGISSRQECKGPLGEKTGSKPRVALLLRGESFRHGFGQYDRHTSVTPEAWKNQRTASESHVKYFIEPLEACGIAVDVFIATYKPNHYEHNASKDLIDFYDGRTVKSSLVDFDHATRRGTPLSPDLSLIRDQSAVGAGSSAWHDVVPFIDASANHSDPKESSQVLNYARTLDLLVSHFNETGVAYDGFLLMRIDVILKKSLPDLESANWTDVLFSFHEWEMGGGRPGNVRGQRVPDTLLWFPWRYANCAIEAGFREHYSFQLRDVTHSPPSNEIQDAHSHVDFMIDEFHDANSMIDWNPLYRLVRPEQKFDFHGGTAMLVVGVRAASMEELMMVRDRVVTNIRLQGDPPIVPADTYAFHWNQSICKDPYFSKLWPPGVHGIQVTCPGCGETFYPAGVPTVSCSKFDPATMHDAFSQLLAREDFDIEHPDVAYMRRWGYALLNTTKGMQRHQQAADQQFDYQVVYVVRDDYLVGRNNSHLLGYSPSKVYVAFNASKANWVPSNVVLSTVAVGKLAAAVEENHWPVFKSDLDQTAAGSAAPVPQSTRMLRQAEPAPLPHSTRMLRQDAVTAWISSVTGLPVEMDSMLS